MDLSDRIEKQLELRAPLSRVWRALTDYREFGQWFGVEVAGPFVIGELARGRITHPGYEHLIWAARITEMVPEKMFSFTWHPFAIEPDVDYSDELPTLVEFRLKRRAYGTLLTLSESGFDKIPFGRRFNAFRGNAEGWDAQMKNIERYVSSES